MASGIAFKMKGGTPEGARQGNPMLTMADNPQQSSDSGVVTFFNNGLFKKKLRWKIENPPNHSERWQITPEMAETMLEWNDRNRPIEAGKVKRFAQAMVEGRWPYTGQTISFSKQRLLDGQHRLLALEQLLHRVEEPPAGRAGLDEKVVGHGLLGTGIGQATVPASVDDPEAIKIEPERQRPEPVEVRG